MKTQVVWMVLLHVLGAAGYGATMVRTVADGNWAAAGEWMNVADGSDQHVPASGDSGILNNNANATVDTVVAETPSIITVNNQNTTVQTSCTLTITETGSLSGNNIYVGANDATGIVSITSGGSLSGTTMILGNVNAVQPSTLAFTLDTSGFQQPISVAGTLYIRPGQKLIVDASAYTGTADVELITFGTLVGSFEVDNITITGLSGASISYDNDSIKLKLSEYTDELSAVAALGNLTNAPVMRADDTTMITASVSPGEMKALFYDALDYNGSPTRVFAYVGIPAEAASGSPVPGIVLVHGGGGTAFSDWVELWTSRGYAAISIAVEGQTDSTVPPVMDTGWHIHNMPGPVRVGIYGDSGVTLTNQWMYHAVADTILANSLLRALPEVDAGKVGLMGVSWGGVIASTAIGIDDRFCFAIPTYGCGNKDIAENIYGDILGNDELYKQVWDPMVRIGNATLPVLWYSWPQEWHFPLYCQRDTYTAAPGSRMVSLVPGMNHGHQAAWNRPESYAYADSIVHDDAPWCVQQSLSLSNGTAVVMFHSSKTLDSASLISTLNTGLTGDRTWSEHPATLTDNGGGNYTVSAALPQYTTAWFVNAHSGSLVVSSDFQETDAPPPSNIVYSVSANWSSRAVKGNDRVTITNGAIVTLDQNSAALELTVADGTLLVNGDYTLSLNSALVINSDGNVRLNNGTISSDANSLSVDGLFSLDGGIFEFSTAGKGYTVSGSGAVNVRSGRLALTGGAATDVTKLNADMEICGGTVDLDGQIYVGNNVATEFKVVGDDAVINIERLNQGAGGNSGTFRFVLNERGVSAVNVGAWMSLDNLVVEVNGSAYRGGADNIPLLDSLNLAGLADSGNLSADGFAAMGLDAAVVQDGEPGKDWVQLVLAENEYGAWASDKGLSGDDAHMNADPDGNGRDNLMEFSTGNGFPAFDRDQSTSNAVKIIYYRRKTGTLVYTLEASSNLISGAWSTNGITKTGIGFVDDEYEAVTNTVPAQATAFARLMLESS